MLATCRHVILAIKSYYYDVMSVYKNAFGELK